MQSLGTGGPGRIAPTLQARVSPLDPSQVRLTWAQGCNPQATDHAVYEGTLGLWYSHVARACSTAGLLTIDLLPDPGNRYFLVVPLEAGEEGSYGIRSGGLERPIGAAACLPQPPSPACP